MAAKNIDSIIFLDECGIDDNEEYPRGWALRGSRLQATKSGIPRKRLSIISTLNKKTLLAPMIFEGPCNRDVFETYLEKVLVPKLLPGKTLVLDNASFHKGGRIRQIIESAACYLLYLPAYSPDLNPIEHYWHAIKNSIRKALPIVSYNLYLAAQIAFQDVSC